MEIKRTNSSDPDFVKLVKLLDSELAERDGEEHSFYTQFNKLDNIKHAVVLYKNHLPVSCGAIKEFATDTMEIKRMYTLPTWRGQKHATAILAELEKWAAELSFKRCVLETGKKQPEAIQLYIKNGYQYIANYGQYEGVANSVCFEKRL